VRKPIVELVVGLFMLIGIVALVILAFKISGLTSFGNSKTYTVTADFDNIGDLKPRAPVTLAGVVVGQVGKIVLDSKTFRAHVVLLIYAKNNDIPTDSSASIFTQGLLGSNYISLTPGFADTNLKNGDDIVFSAPLGNTFKIENKKTLLIGAGIGVAPLFYLNKQLKEIGAKTLFASGFLTKNDIINVVGQECPTYCHEDFQSRLGLLAQQQVFDFISTDDGSSGNKGSICDYLEKLIADFKPEKIVSCAPHPVLKIVAQTAEKHGIECEVCMEKVMACGIGVCRGCVVKIKKGNEVINKTVCKDGPVFDGKEVVW
jgi:phospholipid/cholesterol/gamma-HCH transport system substrate-binding protein